MTPTAELHRSIELGEKAEMHRWKLQATGDDTKKYGAFIFVPFWGAVAVCPRESPQFSCHLTNMKAIEAATAMPTLARELLQAREALTPKPIDTAPKDGTKILLLKIAGHPAHPTALWWCVLGFWSSRWNNWNDGVEPAGLANPNYWMPAPSLTALLPQPTAAQEAK